MKLKEKLSELGYHFSEGLWIAELSDFRVFVTETEDGVQIAKMPSDPEESSLLLRSRCLLAVYTHLLGRVLVFKWIGDVHKPLRERDGSSTSRKQRLESGSFDKRVGTRPDVCDPFPFHACCCCCRPERQE